MKLRHQRQADPQKEWHGNDLNDVIALSVALLYFDDVVTGRSWSAMVSAGRAMSLGTTVTPHLGDRALGATVWAMTTLAAEEG